MLKKIIILLLFLCVLSGDEFLNRIQDSEPPVINVAPDVNEVLEEALRYKNFTFENSYDFETVDRFLFFISGYILNSSEVNALTIKCQDDTTYSVKLYALNDTVWQLKDSIDDLEAFPWQFDLTINDYNFDDQKDIYIQVSSSNGWSLSRGHLIIIDPQSKKLEVHKETRDLANMTIDPNTKTILTQDWQGYDSLDQVHLTIYKNKWINGQLKVIERRDTTIKK